MKNEVEHTLIELGKFEKMVTDHASAWTPKRADDIAGLLAEHIRAHYGEIDEFLMSFDVFDTLLLRNNISEAERFYLSAERMVQILPGNHAVIDVFVARIRAHMLAYQVLPHIDGTPEATLSAIMVGMLTSLDVSLDYLAPILDAELEFEQEMLSVNPYMNSFLNKWHRSNTVVAISDMYMTSAQIMKLLKRHYPDLTFKLYVSGDARLSKRNGSLFRHFLDDISRTPKSILHMGDNLNSDMRKPKEFGIHGLHLPIPTYIKNDRSFNRRAFQKKLTTDYGIELENIV